MSLRFWCKKVRQGQYIANQLWLPLHVVMVLVGKPVTETSESLGKEYDPEPGSGMIHHIAHDLDGSGTGDAEYVLTWDTLDANRDQSRPEGAPAPTMLHLVVVSNNARDSRH